MKRLVCAFLLLCGLSASAQINQPAGNGAQFLDLTDGSKATFKYACEIKAEKTVSISRMGGYFTVKYKKSDYAGLTYTAKATKDVFDLKDWQSISVDVRVRKQEAVDPLTVAVILYPIQEGSVERWNFVVPRNTIPVGTWHRVMMSIQAMEKVPSKKNPQGAELSNISHVDVGSFSGMEVSDVIETDYRNVRLWKTPTDKVEVTPLEK